MRIIRHSSFVSVPWRNGGGVTHEAIRVPTGGESFQWRVSVAEIGASGPFSDFAAYRRFMVLLKGAGVGLKFSSGAKTTSSDGPVPEARQLRRIGDMAIFDGALATHCDLLDGPCVDLNFMVSKALAGVQVRIKEVTRRCSWKLSRGESMLLFPVDGGVELECGSAAERLGSWDLALLSGQDEESVSISAHRRGAEEGVVKVFLATLRV